MSIVSYAQNYEDVRLWRAFKDVSAGRYLDIGTQDPVQDSVSLAFYERGWRGVHVEPTPTYAAAMRAARPDEEVIEAAASTSAVPIRIFEIPSTGLSTGIADIAQRHAKEGWSYQEITVPTVTLAGLFDFMGPELIHWLKIDVEGMEADVIASWGDHAARPAALVIEATAPSTQQPTHEAWLAMVLERDYREVLFDGLSRYFIHKNHAHRAEALALSPNVFDRFEIGQKHFSAGKLQAERESALLEVRRQVEAQREADVAALAKQLATAEVQNEERAAALEEARAIATDVSSRLSAALEDIARLKQSNAERTEAHAAALDVANELTRAANTASAQANHRLVAAQQELLELARANGRLEGQLAALSDAHEAWHADAVAAAAKNEERLIAELKAARSEAAAKAETLLGDIASLNNHIVWREQQLRAAADLLREVPDPFAGLSRFRRALAQRVSGSTRTKSFTAHRNLAAAWLSAVILPHETLRAQEVFSSLEVNSSSVNADQMDEGLLMTILDEPITSVAGLLAPHDRRFIHTAYQAVLGRAPDPQGEAHYLARLRAGDHKLKILRDLRWSGEGRAFTPGVAGLDRAIKRHRWATLPAIGLVVRLLTGAEGNGAIHRQLRMLNNDLGRLAAEQAAAIRAMQGLTERPPALPNPTALSRAAHPSCENATSAGFAERAEDNGQGDHRLGRNASRIFSLMAANMPNGHVKRAD